MLLHNNKKNTFEWLIKFLLKAIQKTSLVIHGLASLDPSLTKDISRA